MLSIILTFIGSFAPGFAAALGDIYIKAKQTQAAREGQQDTSGATVAGSWLHSVTEANRTRAEVRKNEGAWGPLGLITLGIGSAFVFHIWMIVLDSTPWSLFGLIQPHVVGSWGVATLGKAGGALDLVEMEAIRALFYTAPPAAAAIAVAKVFRR